MNEHTIVGLILLGQVIIDAAGDAFRIHKWQVIHHIMESLLLVTFFILWKFFEFNMIYPLLYVTGRIWAFDPLLNWIAGYQLTYAGKSSLYGRLLSWFMNKVKEPGKLIWWIRIIIFLIWLAWLIGGRVIGNYITI